MTTAPTHRARLPAPFLVFDTYTVVSSPRNRMYVLLLVLSFSLHLSLRVRLAHIATYTHHRLVPSPRFTTFPPPLAYSRRLSLSPATRSIGRTGGTSSAALSISYARTHTSTPLAPFVLSVAACYLLSSRQSPTVLLISRLLRSRNI